MPSVEDRAPAGDDANDEENAAAPATGETRGGQQTGSDVRSTGSSSNVTPNDCTRKLKNKKPTGTAAKRCWGCTGILSGGDPHACNSAGCIVCPWCSRTLCSYTPEAAEEARAARTDTRKKSSGNKEASTAEQDRGTETWFARILTEQHGDDLRYTANWGEWSEWSETEGRWKIDHSKQVVERAKVVAYSLLDGARQALGNAIEIQSDAAIAEAEELISIARKFLQRTPMANAIALARSDPTVVTDTNQWDGDPWLLNVANGTIDLSTGELHEHRRGDFITKRSPVPFDPTATASMWQSFLARILPDADVRAYLQRALGYCITGAIRDHVLHIFWGKGSNGKSTLIETVGYVLGDYAGTAPLSLLIQSKGDRHPTELALLLGLRLVTVSESPEDGRLNENLMKTLTGGDRIVARRMREDFWHFNPTHKLILSTNYPPQIVGTDFGVWRRLRLMPFNEKIPDAEQDLDLKQKLREHEAPGILAWLVEGALMYQRDGLNPPDAVMLATNEYRESQDFLDQFLTECVIESNGDFIAATRLHAAFVAWCNANGVPERRQLGQRTLTSRLKDCGFAYTNKPSRGFKNLRLVTDGGDVSNVQTGMTANPDAT